VPVVILPPSIVVVLALIAVAGLYAAIDDDTSYLVAISDVLILAGSNVVKFNDI